MHATPAQHRRAGYSFIELLVATASAAVLMGGLASALLIASRALDLDEGSTANRTRTVEVVDQMMQDVRNALTFTERTATAMTFTVPDRNGDSSPETLRYAWSGTAGDPLTLEFNGAAAIVVVADVTTLDLTYLERFVAAPVIDGETSTQTVLMVSSQAPDADDPNGPTNAEQLRINVIESWGYQVSLIHQTASASEFTTALSNAVAVYVPGETSPTALGAKLDDATIGVVTESFAHAQQLGIFDTGLGFSLDWTNLEINISSHYITAGFASPVTVLTTAEPIKWTNALLSPDAQTLASINFGSPFPTLVILESGTARAGGGTTAGRRAQLPWGEGGFDASSLSTDGQTMLQRTIEWAAGAGESAGGDGVVYHEFTEAKLTSNGTSLDIDVPPGYAADDLLIAVVAPDGDESLAAPAGWTLVDAGTGDARVTLGVWWKLAAASEPSTYNFSWGGSERAYGWIMRFTGHDTASPINGFATASGSSSNAPPSPAVTTTEDNCMILRIGGFDDDDITVDNTGLAGHTSITMDASNASLGASGGAGYVELATAGDSGASAFALTALEQYRTLTIAIAPEAP